MVPSVSSKNSNDPSETASEKARNASIYFEENKAALEQARILLERVQEECNKLRLERDIIQQEAFASAEYFEADIKTKKNLIDELQIKLEERENEIVTIRKEWQEELTTLAMAAKMEKAELINRIAKTEKDLYTLHHFSEKKAQLEQELADAKLQNILVVAEGKQELAEKERKYIEQSVNLKRDFEKNLEKLHVKLNGETENRVGLRVKNILLENERLGNEIRMHIEMTSDLQKDIVNLRSELANASRGMGLLRDADTLYAQRNTTQARVIAENNNKVQNLEKSIAEVVKQYGAERRALEEEHLKTIAKFQDERQVMHRIIETKMQELDRMRQSAQQMLIERGEVEAFLVQSLHYVMQEIENSKRQQQQQQQSVKFCKRALKTAAAAATSATAKPSSATSSTSTTSSTLLSEKKKKKKKKGKEESNEEVDVIEKQVEEEVPVKMEASVDISELSWEDKEKVLRHLFEKINNAHQIPGAVAVEHNKRCYPNVFSVDDMNSDHLHQLHGIVSDAGRVIV